MKQAIEKALVKLSVFGKGAEPVVTAVEGNVATAVVSSKAYEVEFTAKEGAYAFGKPKPTSIAWTPEVMAELHPETFTAKEAERVEFTLAEDDTHRADPANGDYPVIIIQEGENKTKHRRYTKNAVCEADVTKYMGLPMHLDHAGNEGETPVRSVKDLAGVVKTAWHGISEGGAAQVRATVHVFDSWLRERLADADFRKLVGISHVADVAGRVENIAGKAGRCIEAITQPHAVDWVSRAAFGGRVAESESDPITNRAEDLMALESLSLADLKRERPDLIEAVGAEFRAQEAESEESKATAAELAVANKRAQEAEAQVQRMKLDQTVAAEAAKPDYKIPDTVRPKVVEIVTARLSGQPIADDKLSATVAEAVKSVADIGQGFAAPVKPVVPAGAGADGKGEPSPRERLQTLSDKLIGV